MSRMSERDKDQAEHGAEALLRRRLADERAARGRTFPDLIGNVIADSMTEERRFPFHAWARSTGFTYPPAAKDFLAYSGSAVEAYFARAFATRPGVEFCDHRAFTKDHMLELQVPCGAYRIDAKVCDGTTCLAIEIDGIGFHHKSKEKVAADYVRQRRIVLKGYVVIRFTAQEILTNPDECWRQVEAILAARRQLDAKSLQKRGT